MNYKKYLNFFFLFLFLILKSYSFSNLYKISIEEIINKKNKSNADYSFAVVGGGPGGIIIVGYLLELGIPANDICWIDPAFNVGRLGEFYSNVPANSPNSDFVRLLKDCKTFSEIDGPAIQYLYSLSPSDYSTLKIIIDPLQEITNFLIKKVNSIVGKIDSLEFIDDVWNVSANEIKIKARSVILATGSYPRKLSNSENIKEIPLDLALDKNNLTTLVENSDSVAVFGSAHSAVLILKYLSEIFVNKIINFYRSPFIYATSLTGEILNPHSGLRGIAAKFAREVLEANPPKNLFRYENTSENIKIHLPSCNKIIYAVGYEKNSLPQIIVDSTVFSPIFDPENGTLGPRLFGIGIAFPGLSETSTGSKEQSIGLNSFLKYAQTLAPSWLTKNINYSLEMDSIIEKLSAYDSLFNIQIL